MIQLQTHLFRFESCDGYDTPIEEINLFRRILHDSINNCLSVAFAKSTNEEFQDQFRFFRFMIEIYSFHESKSDYPCSQ